MRTKLLGIDGDGEVYALAIYDLEIEKYEKIITFYSFDDLKDEIERLEIDLYHIIFNNENIKLSKYLIENYEPYLISKPSTFLTKNRVFGVFPSRDIASYGFHTQSVKQVESVTNIINYINMKNKGL